MHYIQYMYVYVTRSDVEVLKTVSDNWLTIKPYKWIKIIIYPLPPPPPPPILSPDETLTCKNMSSNHIDIYKPTLCIIICQFVPFLFFSHLSDSTGSSHTTYPYMHMSYKMIYWLPNASFRPNRQKIPLANKSPCTVFTIRIVPVPHDYYRHML